MEPVLIFYSLKKVLSDTNKLLYITIAVILANIVVDLSPIQESCKLSKNVSVLEHSSQTILAAKLQIQVRFIPETI